MISSDDRNGRDRLPDNLERNPGIGQSKGAFATGEDPQSIQGENTTEGDVDNDSTPTDGVPQGEKARTNA
ncbi:MAG TPA: hypothetical protein VFR52_07815 [Sphingomicrobium sp.]|nr:hypothetical protein [Sphingomicrobium sp.]